MASERNFFESFGWEIIDRTNQCFSTFEFLDDFFSRAIDDCEVCPDEFVVEQAVLAAFFLWVLNSS